MRRGATVVAEPLLKATAVLGIAGPMFHAYGIHRNMGGWRNWSQMILQGPPLPAPPAFLGIAVAGLGILPLLRAAPMSEFRTPYLTYDVLDKWDSPSWNDQTREAVRAEARGSPEATLPQPRSNGRCSKPSSRG